ncbi:MAG: hypothetical protein JRJ34_08975, partial [Deltaproteobacteria bacterium]|nr:hypothetical protein [Deltaproteobacteria bacterium]
MSERESEDSIHIIAFFILEIGILSLELKEVLIMPDSVKTIHFRRWVFWTGIFNIVAYAPLLCPFTLKTFLGTSSGLGNALGLGGTVLS